MVEQGDIIKLNGIRALALVVSTDYFNSCGMAAMCPICPTGEISLLHIPFATETITGYVECEHLKIIDYQARGYRIVDRVDTMTRINVADTIQSIFDYI